MTNTVPESVVQVFAPPTFRFPGNWTHLPMTDARERDAAVGRLLEAVKRDAPAQAVSAARQGISRALAEASDSGLIEAYLGAPVTAGVPVTAMMLVHSPSIRLSPALGTEPTDVMDVFLEGLKRTGHSAPDAARFRVGPSEVSRAVSVREVTVDESTGEPKRPGELTVFFWVTIPGAKQVLPIVFTSPFVDLREPLVALFSAIVSTLDWSAKR
jgi:hypothetical protein